MATRAETELHWTPDPEANRLIASDGNALLIGFALDQQVPVPKAFSGPIELQKRLGHLDPGRIAVTDPDELVEVFVRRPAIHRFPAAMAKRVQSLCAVIERDYDGDGYRPDGWEEALPNHPTLGDVDSAEALTTYQADKRAHKAAQRAAKSS
jgi:uncharacterized HhH-GPD family protein